MKTVAIVGMGYVGITLAAVLMDTGFEVIGIERDEEKCKLLKDGKLPIYENDLSLVFNKNYHNLIDVVTPQENLSVDAIFITVGTPLHKDKSLNLDNFQNAIKEISTSLKPGTLIMTRSTVPVGTCTNMLIPLIKKLVSPELFETLLFASAPERTIEGNAIVELRKNPQIIGSNQPRAIEKAKEIFNKITPNIITCDTFEEAELLKLTDNTYREYMFSFSNYISMMANKIGLDGYAIAAKANYKYPRNKLAKPSPGIGGPCLSKDAYIFAASNWGEDADNDAAIILNSRVLNDKVMNGIAQDILDSSGDGEIHLLGVAFKGDPPTDDIRDSTSLIMYELLKHDRTVKCYDPVVESAVLQSDHDLETIEQHEIGANASAVVILNNHNNYISYDWDVIASRMVSDRKLVYDTWNILEPIKESIPNNIKYKRI